MSGYPTNQELRRNAYTAPIAVLVRRSARVQMNAALLIQLEGMKLCHRGSIVSQVINGCPNDRELESVKGLGEQGVQVLDGADASCDVRGVVVSAVVWNEHSNVFDERRNDVGVLRRGHVGGGGTSGRSKGRDSRQLAPSEASAGRVWARSQCQQARWTCRECSST